MIPLLKFFAGPLLVKPMWVGNFFRVVSLRSRIISLVWSGLKVDFRQLIRKKVLTAVEFEDKMGQAVAGSKSRA